MKEHKPDRQAKTTNAMNSELPPEKHPSGARIEEMAEKSETGMHGETLRPSEREPKYVPTEDKAEGERE
jgi:hypothetical protein